MAKFHNVLKNQVVVIGLMLCVMLAFGLYFWDRDRVNKRAHSAYGIWTITMDDESTPYTFRGPLGMFLIHRSKVTSLRKLTASSTSLTMQWHYESGEPWVVWAVENRVNRWENDGETLLSASVDIVSPGKDTAAHAESIHLDHLINNPNPAVNADFVGKVWNDTALKFELGSSNYFRIEERMPYDARVINCTGTAYCRLEGARVNETLALDSVSVLREDVSNWRLYQDKARSLAIQAIVEKPGTN